MSHDDAVAALEALPETARISVARLLPSDVIVLEYPGYWMPEAKARLVTQLKPIWPDNKIIVLDHGITLKIIEGAV